MRGTTSATQLAAAAGVRLLSEAGPRQWIHSSYVLREPRSACTATRAATQTRGHALRPLNWQTYKRSHTSIKVGLSLLSLSGGDPRANDMRRVGIACDGRAGDSGNGADPKSTANPSSRARTPPTHLVSPPTPLSAYTRCARDRVWGCGLKIAGLNAAMRKSPESCKLLSRVRA